MKILDPYVYEGTNVLKNKFKITDLNKLEEAESTFVTYRLVELRKEPLQINSVYDIKKIHKILFSDVFEWAGEYRKLTIYKVEEILHGYSVDYTPFEYIEKEMIDLENKYKKIDWNVLNEKEKIDSAINIVQELWQIHCFREGNTRAVTIFLYFLLKTLGINLNTNFIGKHSKFFRNSLVLASQYSESNFEYLRGIVYDSVTFSNPDDQKYKTIDGQDVEKYHYSYHTIEKMKTKNKKA